MTLMHADSSRPTTGQPLVTILVPCFNGARLLRQSLDSLVAQTYSNVEILLLDDASTDDTPNIAAEYAGRIAYVRQPVNLGQFGNVNDGIGRASGELIAVYHADDIYEPTIVESEVEYLLSHPEVGAVFASDIFVDADGREYGRLSLPPEVRGEAPLSYSVVLNGLLTYRNRFLVGPSAMVRASVYREVGTYRGDRYRIASDMEMWLRIARRYPIAVLEEHLMRYRHFHENSTQQYHRLRTEPDLHFLILNEHLTDGGRAIASPRSLRAHAAHFSEDRIMASISHYIKGELPEGRRALRGASLRAIARSPQVQRWRLSVILIGLHILYRLPRIEAIATAMFNRWHVKRPPR